MDEETKQRVFEPFFTTKEMGRGTGLGLASAYGIIKNHDGFVDVSSEKDYGTTFTIYLPASLKEVKKEKISKDMTIIRGKETVLLVDDEKIILDVGDEILRGLGYSVFLAGCGREAVEIFKEKKDEIDMVILDMIMPEMGGDEVFERIKEIRPDIKILLSSGYIIRDKRKEILERGCDGYIQKPYSVESLSWRIREILDAG